MCVHVCTYVCVYVCMCVAYLHMYINAIHFCMVCMHVRMLQSSTFICTCICMYLCMYEACTGPPTPNHMRTHLLTYRAAVA